MTLIYPRTCMRVKEEMSATAVVGVTPASSQESREQCDKLGDLVDKLDNVNIDGNGVATSDPERIIKHPLQNAWTLWFFKNDKSKSWADNLRVITSFDTVEDFWA